MCYHSLGLLGNLPWVTETAGLGNKACVLLSPSIEEIPLYLNQCTSMLKISLRWKLVTEEEILELYIVVHG